MQVTETKNDPKPEGIFLPIEGIAVDQPLDVVVAKMKVLTSEVKGLKGQLAELPEGESPERVQLQKQLNSVLKDHIKWGEPLFARLSYLFPPKTFSLDD
jgi:hypothetical protein